MEYVSATIDELPVEQMTALDNGHQLEVLKESERGEHPAAKMAETLEEFQAMSPTQVDVDLVLDDAALLTGGMVPVKAFIRSEASANALRQKRKRQRQVEGGAKQLSVLAPADDASRNAIKAVGTAMREKGLDASLVEHLANSDAAYASKLFNLDATVVERVAGCDVEAVERLFEVATMLGSDALFVFQLMQLDQDLVRRIAPLSPAQVARALDLVEAEVVADEPERADAAPPSRGWFDTLLERFKPA